MIDIYREISRRLAAGERVAPATAISVKRSTPREPGTKMLLAADGHIFGTVGGCVEAEVWRVALDAISTGRPRVVCVDLTEDVDTSSRGALCGGVMDVFVETLRPGE